MDISREQFLDSLKNSGLKIDVALVKKAIDFATKHHEGQFRSSGEPYISHPIAVANIVASMNLDTASIVTALLHDTVEDTDVTEEQIAKEFNKEISQLVSGVTKLTRIKFKSDQIKQAENFRKLLLAMSEDIRVLLVKIADRYHNMLTIDHLKPSKSQRIALETMEIYAPLAERIGIHKFKTELQDMSFKVLYPNVRESILKRLNEIATDGKKNIQNIIKEIKALMKDSSIDCEVFGRQKTPYSIWMKMNQKNIGFDQLSDIMAFRIIVKDLASCYQALGAIHSKYKMVPNHFHDFISTPKDNGYQSIHTIVIGPENQRIEVQIRTSDMHQVAELGVAAHWTYKQKYSSHDGKQFRWIRELLAILDQAKDPEEFISNTKLEMNYDQVFCFTPKGQLVPLPKGATTVDFAYSVHSEVGYHCVGSKVNGNLVPLRTELKNGDQVEILTNKAQVPKRDWESFVITGRAKSEIRKFLRQQTIDQYSDLGKTLLEKAFRNHNVEFKEDALRKNISKFGKQSLEDLYASIGDGTIRREEVVKIFKPKPSLVDKISFLNFRKAPRDPNPISIKGMIPGLAIHYAGCCHPIPGDKIVGIVHTGKGITVHSSTCDYLKHLNKNDFEPIPLKWDDDEIGLYSARIVAKLGNEPGGLAVLSSELAKENCNITNFNIINRNPEIFEVLIDIEVKDKDHLSNVMLALKQKKEILDIERYKS